ncbi:MAG: polyprenyl synthetase family protein [Planctomycetota bacterium]
MVDSEQRTTPTVPTDRFQQAREDLLREIEGALESACDGIGNGCPRRLVDAIRYALLAPGKRLRPMLVLMAAEACGGERSAAMPAAVAVEMVHAYSLIHDDLPAMDDDDLRRGRPTVHIEFDEATAILAGDALQPLAVSHLCGGISDPAICAEAVRLLMEAAGPRQLVGGQADDLAAESGQLPDEVARALGSMGELDSGSPRKSSHEEHFEAEPLRFLESVHRRKTGALFRVSLELGGLLSGGNADQRLALEKYAEHLGLAFQVVDDLLDHTADESAMGKRVGKDLDRGKLTYPGLLGVSQTREFARQLVNDAKQQLSVFGEPAWRLNLLADYVLERTN